MLLIENLKVWLNNRNRTEPVRTIVLHATAGSTFMGAFTTLLKKKFSYNYIIEDQRETDGLIKKCVPVGKVAFHAGVSSGPYGDNVNRYGVGISFVNSNTGQDPYSDAQFISCRDLCVELVKACPQIDTITTHYWISPGRKTDPRGFHINKLAEEINKLLPANRKIKVWSAYLGTKPELM